MLDLLGGFDGEIAELDQEIGGIEI